MTRTGIDFKSGAGKISPIDRDKLCIVQILKNKYQSPMATPCLDA